VPSYEYYYRSNGDCPAKEFIDDPRRSTIRTNIHARLAMLEKFGSGDIDTLIENNTLVPINNKRGQWIKGLYELKCKTWRIATYHDLRIDCFMLFNGWIKKRNIQSRDISKAIDLFSEYINKRGVT